MDASADRSLLVIRSRSDVESGAYYLFDTTKHSLSLICRGNPDLDPAQLPRLRNIRYPARDGAKIPGYLIKPLDASAGPWPLVVLPHGGAVQRDYWRYSFLAQFLASRGYAVLQMNFRGSYGYGRKWFQDAHQDWGGVSYDDIIDGVRLAIKGGIADPNHIAIGGFSFGGYEALLASIRDKNLFRCAISIDGVSDISTLTERFFIVRGAIFEQASSDAAKLRAESPLRHVQDIQIPVLLVSNDQDYMSGDQTRVMAAALSKAGKPHDWVDIESGDQNWSYTEDRLALLKAVDKFLNGCMSAAPAN